MIIVHLRNNWRYYFLEFAGLAGFVLTVVLTSIFLEHPDLPVMNGVIKYYDTLRRVPLGIIKGSYITAMILLFGKTSGAHINPAVTVAFFRLGKINSGDAFCYVVAQFAGAICGAALLKLILAYYFAHPAIHYGSSQPKPPHGALVAFISEYIIAFIFMLATLRFASSKRLQKYLALMSGALICVYVILELPFSGTSLNPARSLAAATVSNNWRFVWIYFTAPVLGMLSAIEAYKIWRYRHLQREMKCSDAETALPEPEDFQEIHNYPVCNSKKRVDACTGSKDNTLSG